jgi:hypothetical protein
VNLTRDLLAASSLALTLTGCIDSAPQRTPTFYENHPAAAQLQLDRCGTRPLTRYDAECSNAMAGAIEGAVRGRGGVQNPYAPSKRS